MKLYTWLRLQVIKQQLMRGNLLVLFYGKTRGCSLYEEYMEIYLRRKSEPFIVRYENTSYNRSEMSESFKSDYMIKHWLTQREIKRKYCFITVRTDAGTLDIKTSNLNAYEMLITQSKAMRYNKVEEIIYKDYSLDCSGGYLSIGYSYKKKLFDNIIEYNNYEEITYTENN